MKRAELLALEYYKKSAFTGSFGAFRFKIEKYEPEGEKKQLRLCSWVGPFAFDHTDESEKNYAFFEYSDQGLSLIADELSKYEEKYHEI